MSCIWVLFAEGSSRLGWFGVGFIVSRLLGFCSVLLRRVLYFAEVGWPGVARHATHFFCVAKKSKQKKATRSLGPCASLRATCAARLRRGLAQTRLRLRQARSLIRLRLRCSAQPGRGNRE